MSLKFLNKSSPNKKKLQLSLEGPRKGASPHVASADNVAAEKFIHEMQHVIVRTDVIHLNKFSVSMRLPCSRKKRLAGLSSLERKNWHPALKLPKADLCCFWVVMLMGEGL